MGVVSGDVRIERLSRFFFIAPSWPVSLAIIIILGFIIDGASLRFGQNIRFFGSLCFTIPALTGFLATKPLVNLFSGQITWNRSALLALGCTVFLVIISLIGMVVSISLLPFSYAIALGFIFGARLVVLAAIADYRLSRVVLPAFIQSGMGILIGIYLFSPPFGLFGVISSVVFGIGFVLLIWAVERPLYRAFHIHGLNFLNTFIAHITDGSKTMEDFFHEIGEEVYVPQVSIFFRDDNGKGVLFTVPNIHPGPLGEIGGGNLPHYLQSAFSELVMVSHGTATHDFNLVAEDEIKIIVSAIKEASRNLVFSRDASKSYRYHHGSVSVLYQVFHDTLLIVSTRSPEKTEDIEFGVGMAIMAEGHRAFNNIAFVDAHNCFTGDISTVQPGTLAAYEYQSAALKAINEGPGLEKFPFRMGSAQVIPPYSRKEGFGDQGIEILIIEAGMQKTAYILIDGNNVQAGVRNLLRDHALTRVDEAEIMTTDSHVVNILSGKNPVGLNIPPELIIPYIDQALNEALQNLAPGEAAGSTALCERVRVFGSQRVVQMASTVNAMILFIPPLSAAVLLLAFLLSLMLYMIII
jgi:putative membrane protein